MAVRHAFALRMLPGHVLVPLPYDGDDPRMRALARTFTDAGDVAGLYALAADPVPDAADSSLAYWHEFASEALRALCHVPETQPFSEEAITPPEPARFTAWVLARPPQQGAEYITETCLIELWHRMIAWAVQEAEAFGGLGPFLEKIAPKWARVGRVTVHLAENKNDAEYPFAFMATYAAGMTKSGSLRRLPLGDALQEFAGAGKKSELLRLLSPLHAAAKRSALIENLVATGDVFHPLAWTAREAFDFLQEIPRYEECGLLARLPNWWRKRSRAQVRVDLGKKKGAPLGASALLNFRVSLVVNGQTLSPDEVEELLERAEGLVLLRGEWVEVDREKLNEALLHWRRVEAQVGPDGLSFVQGMRMLAGAGTNFTENVELQEHAAWTQVAASEALQHMLDELRDGEGLQGPSPKGLQGTLRAYQLDGLNWLWLCSSLGLGSCLADDMGLGKTIQVLSTLLRYREEVSKGNRRPALLVVPASLIGNWKDEAQRFAPDLRLRVAHRSECSAVDMSVLAEQSESVLQDIDLVITTYSMVTRLDWLSAFDWSWIILDEAQAIKNPAAQQTRAIKKLQGRSRIALTGTPVENRLGDLWSLFDFINPGLLGSAAQFNDFAQTLESREPADYAPLRNLVAPYILRRMKTDPDIVPDLPDKTEMRADCGLAEAQAVLYRHSVRALAEGLASDELSDMERKGLVLKYLMHFKQICNHPSQLLGDGEYDPAASGKFERLGALCREIASRGEKVLVFTQFREMVGPLSDFLATIFGREGAVLHGGTPVARRKTLVADFQRDHGPPFFVLSIKAGGTGLNLTAASHVIHFDRWWNPAVENQATDRAFRIGQKRNVLVHKFVTRGTIEEKIDQTIREKQHMSDALLEGGAENALTEMSDAEILEMVALDIDRALI